MLQKVAAVIPCYRVRDHILGVLASCPPEIQGIYVVDDACPEQSGGLVRLHVRDPRVRIITLEKNSGVGAAVLAGYRAALADGFDIMAKIDGDGQMDPMLVPSLVAPIVSGEADYVKGNRFYSISATRSMPAPRLLGNALLSFITKLSSGYWSLFDPTNGFTAIHRKAAESLDFERIAPRYFFETDLLIKLGDVRAVVIDLPMAAVYGEEKSSFKASRELAKFVGGHVYSIFRRIFYSYFVRDFNIASLNLLFGVLLLCFGFVFGLVGWRQSIASGVPATTGTVMLSVLPILGGLQMVLFFLSFDIANEPKRPLQKSAKLSHLAVPARGENRTGGQE